MIIWISGQFNVSADLVEDNQIDIVLFLMGATNYMNESFVVEWKIYISLGCPYEDHGMKKFRGNTYSIPTNQILVTFLMVMINADCSVILA